MGSDEKAQGKDSKPMSSRLTATLQNRADGGYTAVRGAEDARSGQGPNKVEPGPGGVAAENTERWIPRRQSPRCPGTSRLIARSNFRRRKDFHRSLVRDSPQHSTSAEGFTCIIQHERRADWRKSGHRQAWQRCVAHSKGTNSSRRSSRRRGTRAASRRSQGRLKNRLSHHRALACSFVIIPYCTYQSPFDHSPSH